MVRSSYVEVAYVRHAGTLGARFELVDAEPFGNALRLMEVVSMSGEPARRRTRARRVVIPARTSRPQSTDVVRSRAIRRERLAADGWPLEDVSPLSTHDSRRAHPYVARRWPAAAPRAGRQPLGLLGAQRASARRVFEAVRDADGAGVRLTTPRDRGVVQLGPKQRLKPRARPSCLRSSACWRRHRRHKKNPSRWFLADVPLADCSPGRACHPPRPSTSVRVQRLRSGSRSRHSEPGCETLIEQEERAAKAPGDYGPTVRGGGDGSGGVPTTGRRRASARDARARGSTSAPVSPGFASRSHWQTELSRWLNADVSLDGAVWRRVGRMTAMCVATFALRAAAGGRMTRYRRGWLRRRG